MIEINLYIEQSEVDMNICLVHIWVTQFIAHDSWVC